MSTRQGEEVVNRGKSKRKFGGRRFHCRPLERRKRIIAHRLMDTGERANTTFHSESKIKSPVCPVSPVYQSLLLQVQTQWAFL